MCCYVVLGSHVTFNCGFLFSTGSTVIPSGYLVCLCLVLLHYKIIVHSIKFVAPGF